MCHASEQEDSFGRPLTQELSTEWLSCILIEGRRKMCVAQVVVDAVVGWIRRCARRGLRLRRCDLSGAWNSEDAKSRVCTRWTLSLLVTRRFLSSLHVNHPSLSTYDSHPLSSFLNALFHMQSHLPQRASVTVLTLRSSQGSSTSDWKHLSNCSSYSTIRHSYSIRNRRSAITPLLCNTHADAFTFSAFRAQEWYQSYPLPPSSLPLLSPNLISIVYLRSLFHAQLRARVEFSSNLGEDHAILTIVNRSLSVTFWILFRFVPVWLFPNFRFFSWQGRATLYIIAPIQCNITITDRILYVSFYNLEFNWLGWLFPRDGRHVSASCYGNSAFLFHSIKTYPYRVLWACCSGVLYPTIWYGLDVYWPLFFVHRFFSWQISSGKAFHHFLFLL